jgi:hypothetical protein
MEVNSTQPIHHQLSKPTVWKKLAFKKAAICIFTLINFHLMAQYLSHTKQTLNYMEAYLKNFHQNQDIILEFRKSKTTYERQGRLIKYIE